MKKDEYYLYIPPTYPISDNHRPYIFTQGIFMDSNAQCLCDHCLYTEFYLSFEREWQME